MFLPDDEASAPIEGLKLIHHRVIAPSVLLCRWEDLIGLPGHNRIVDAGVNSADDNRALHQSAKETHQQTLVPNGYCHIFSCI